MHRRQRRRCPRQPRVNRGQLNLAQQKFLFDKQQAVEASANPFAGLEPDQKIEFMDRVNTVDRAGRVATDLIDYYNRSGTGEITLSPIDRETLGAEWQGAMLPYLQQRFKAGAMQAGEQALFQELSGDPAKIFSLTRVSSKTLFKMWAADIGPSDRMPSLLRHRCSAAAKRPKPGAWCRPSPRWSAKRCPCLLWAPRRKALVSLP